MKNKKIILLAISLIMAVLFAAPLMAQKGTITTPDGLVSYHIDTATGMIVYDSAVLADLNFDHSGVISFLGARTFIRLLNTQDKTEADQIYFNKIVEKAGPVDYYTIMQEAIQDINHEYEEYFLQLKINNLESVLKFGKETGKFTPALTLKMNGFPSLFL